MNIITNIAYYLTYSVKLVASLFKRLITRGAGGQPRVKNTPETPNLKELSDHLSAHPPKEGQRSIADISKGVFSLILLNTPLDDWPALMQTNTTFKRWTVRIFIQNIVVQRPDLLLNELAADKISLKSITEFYNTLHSLEHHTTTLLKTRLQEAAFAPTVGYCKWRPKDREAHANSLIRIAEQAKRPHLLQSIGPEVIALLEIHANASNSPASSTAKALKAALNLKDTPVNVNNKTQEYLLNLTKWGTHSLRYSLTDPQLVIAVGQDCQRQPLSIKPLVTPILQATLDANPLRDEDPEIRQNALALLCFIAEASLIPKELAPAIIQATLDANSLRNENPQTQIDTLALLSFIAQASPIPKELAPAIIQATLDTNSLRNEDPQTQMDALTLLSFIAQASLVPKELAPAIIQATLDANSLRNENPQIPMEALTLLIFIAEASLVPKELAPAIIQTTLDANSLRNENPEIRQNTLVLLNFIAEASLVPKELAPAIIQATLDANSLRNENSYIQQSALALLSCIAKASLVPKELAPAIIQATLDANSLQDENPEIQQSASILIRELETST